MKVGDLILWRSTYDTQIGIMLYDNIEGGTIKFYDFERERTFWRVRSECKTISPGSSIG